MTYCATSQQIAPFEHRHYGTTHSHPNNPKHSITVHIPDHSNEEHSETANDSLHEDASLLRNTLLTPTSSNHARDRLMHFFTPDHQYRSLKPNVRQFYTSQNEFINSLIELSTVDHHLDDDYEQPSTAAYLAIQISLGTTFLLLAMKLGAAVYSGSIAVIASAFDSILDLLSQGTLLLIHRFMLKYDPFNFPSGKGRYEPVSILIFSIIMGIAALMLFLGSVQSLIEGMGHSHHALRMDTMTITILMTVIIIQCCMWVYCKRVASMPIPGASAAAALADDHWNDVVITLLGGVPAIAAGTFERIWYFDAVGGILISLYIAYRWGDTALEQIPLLVGRAAPPAFLNQLTYLAATHDDRIRQIDTIQAYHAGLSYLVEVHIVLPEHMPLREAHDIGESLEQKIEKLDQVQTAFVHLDFETSHMPEHQARQRAAGKTPVVKRVPYPDPNLDHHSNQLPVKEKLVRSFSGPIEV